MGRIRPCCPLGAVRAEGGKTGGVMDNRVRPPREGDKVYWGQPRRLYRVERVDVAAYVLIDQKGRHEVASKSCLEFIDPTLRIAALLSDF